MLTQIRTIYHEHNDVDGYRSSMRVFLERKDIYLNAPMIHKYMNNELGLISIKRKNKHGYQKGKSHKVFDNLIQQDFLAKEQNRKWCTDFTYPFLKYERKLYNCSILDLYDRNIIQA